MSSIQTSTSGATYQTGTVSGLNTQALIDNAVAVKLKAKTALTDKISTNTSKIAAYQDIQTKAQTLQEALNKLKSTSTGTVTNALTDKQITYTSADSTTATNILTATTSSGAQSGTHKVVVKQVAEALSVTSNSQSSSSTALGYTGTFDIGEDGKTASTITVTATMTLADIAAAINATTATSGVKADVLQEAGGSYKLVITGSDTAKDFTVSNVTGTDVLNSLGVTDSGGDFANVSQVAQQAIITLDGTTITSDSNKLSNVLTGFSLTLSNEAPSTTITITLGNNTDGVAEVLADFVSAYNTLRSALTTYQAVNSDGSVPANSYLYNDTLSRSLLQSVNALITASYGTGTSYNGLASLGITLDSSNQLVLDSDTLDTALKNNFSDVQSIFATSGSSVGLADKFYNLLNDYAKDGTGSIATAVTNLTALDTDLQTKADAVQTKADAYEQTLITKYAAMETKMKLAETLKSQIQAILKGSTSDSSS